MFCHKRVMKQIKNFRVGLYWCTLEAAVNKVAVVREAAVKAAGCHVGRCIIRSFF